MRVRIIQVPAGFASEEIRQQWVGVEMPVFEGELPRDGMWSGAENVNGYVVAMSAAVKALQDAGKDDAANFWKHFSTPLLRFNEQDCEPLPD